MLKESKIFLILIFLLLYGCLGALSRAQSSPTQTDPSGTTKQATTKQDTAKQKTHSDHKSDAKKDKAAKGGDTLSASDRRFIMETAMDGMAEVELGRLAAERATNDDVKKFAQKMVDEHSKANEELMQLASQKGITLPKDLDAKHKGLKDRLAKLSGAEFDRQYMREMVNDHNNAVTKFQQESKRAKDADLKAWVAKTLPTLQEHLQMARDTSAKITGGPATSNRPTQ